MLILTRLPSLLLPHLCDAEEVSCPADVQLQDGQPLLLGHARNGALVHLHSKRNMSVTYYYTVNNSSTSHSKPLTAIVIIINQPCYLC
jgi:hypothetical protein